MAYTYLIGWSKLDRWYYGVRYRNGCTPTDLWTKYFTSSKHVLKFRHTYGEPDIIQIRKVFDCRKKAMYWEHKVLKRMHVTTTERFLNKADVWSSHYHGPKVGKAISESLKGIPKSESAKQTMSIAAKKRWNGIDQTGENNPYFQGFYVTPWGTFPASTQAIKAMPFKVDYLTLINWCKNNKRKISKRSKMYNNDMKGKTYADLGFSFQKVG